MILPNLSTDPHAPHRGAYELALTTPDIPSNPYTDLTLHVTFTRPDGTQTLTVPGPGDRLLLLERD